jgi:hypothetical protein
MSRRLAVLFALVWASLASGAPVLDQGRRTASGWCYPDHQDRRVWWLPPPSPVLMVIGGRPGVDFTVFNYQGARATVDADHAWTGAMLQFTLVMPEATEAAAAATRILGTTVDLRTMPPAGIEAEVVFAGVNGARAAAVAEGGESVAGAWRERSFAVGLTPEETAVVHDAWEAGSVVLSVNTAVSAFAFATRPDEDDAAPDRTVVTVDSVAVTVDARRHPEIFRVLELDATMPLGYTGLELGCSELTEGYGLSDLARVIAVVEAEAVNGDVIAKELRFTSRSAPTLEIRFDRAVRLDHGYRLRVVRVYATGRTEEAPPRRIDVWQGFEDICSAPPDERIGPDPRLLY